MASSSAQTSTALVVHAIEDELNALMPELSDLDIVVLVPFISDKPKERRMKESYDDPVPRMSKVTGYSILADYLRFMDAHTVLDILDSRQMRLEAVTFVKQLRQFKFQGSWLDSIDYICNNCRGMDSESLCQLEDDERLLAAAREQLIWEKKLLKDEEDIIVAEHAQLADRLTNVKKDRVKFAVKFSFP